MVRILTTLLLPDGGSATVAGCDVVRDAEALRFRIGLAGQSAAVDENLTGLENLELVGRLYHLGKTEARARGGQILERFGLSDAADRPTKTYSGGMRRRLDVAASLVGRPQVLFLDEPTTGLDPRSRIDVWEFIRELQADGTTLLLTTQYLEEADELTDRIVVIDVGRVIAEGTSNDLKRQIGGEVLELHVTNREETAAVEGILTGLGHGDHVVEPETGLVRIQVGQDGTCGGVRGRPAARRLGRAYRGHRPAQAEPRRRVPVAHRSRGRGGQGADAADPPAAQARGGTLVSATVAMPARGVGPRVRFALADGFVVAWRNLIGIGRVPTVLVFELVQPIMFVLLFRFVYENAFLNIPGGDYVQFLMPGIFVQNAIFGSTATAIGLAEDLKKGLLDRFRSLPMARSAVLVGRTTADIVKNFLLVVVMVVIGYIVGFRFENGLLAAIGVVLLVVTVGFTFSWISATIGLAIKQVEAVQAAIFTLIFPIVFVSAAFVPVVGMSHILQPIARHNPVTYWCNLARWLSIGPVAVVDPATHVATYTFHQLVTYSIGWIALLLAIFVPLSIRLYRRLT